MSKPDKAPQTPIYESDLRLEDTASVIAKRVAEGKKLPLEVMFDTMDAHIDNKNINAAQAVAVQAAPYVHPRLKDLMITGGPEGSSPIRIESSKMKNLSDKELAMLEKLLSKIEGGE